MKQAAVIDACALLPLFLPEEDSAHARALISLLVAGTVRAVHAPNLLYVECAHNLLKGVRRKIITPEKCTSSYRNLLGLPFDIHEFRPLTEVEYRLALDHVIGAYDAIYLSLAKRLGLPLITNDKRLIDKAHGTQRVLLLSDAVAAANQGTLQ